MASASHGGPVPEGRDPEHYDRMRRRVLWSLPSGLYLLGSRAGERRNLMAVSLAVQVATEPKLVGVAIEAGALSCQLVADGGAFALSILRRADRAAVRRFVKPATDVDVGPDGAGTMSGMAVRATASGLPLLDGAAAFLDCQVRHTMALGSHTFFVGEVVDCGFGEAGDPPEILRMEDTRMNYGG